MVVKRQSSSHSCSSFKLAVASVTTAEALQLPFIDDGAGRVDDELMVFFGPCT